MEQNKEDIVKYHQNKRKKHKIKLGTIGTLLLIIGVTLIGTYNIYNKKEAISYKENSEVKYGVNLKENDFFDEPYLEEGIDIVANLINNVDAEFKYNLELDKEIDYKYSYKILAEAQVKEEYKTNILYKTEQVLLNKEEQEVKSNKLEIAEKINVDYNQFNGEIKRFLETYKIAITKNELNVSLYLNVINKATGEYLHENEKAMTVTIPLATNTVEITINEDIEDVQGKIFIQESKNENLEYIAGIGVLALIIGVITLVRLIKYISDTRSAEKMYDDELKRLVFDYKGYIQNIDNPIDYNGYKLINIKSFKELLGIKEELQSPILMYNEENNRRTTFVIINENLLFEYVLEARLIREKLIKRSKEKAEKKNDKNK